MKHAALIPAGDDVSLYTRMATLENKEKEPKMSFYQLKTKQNSIYLEINCMFCQCIKTIRTIMDTDAII